MFGNPLPKLRRKAPVLGKPETGRTRSLRKRGIVLAGTLVGLVALMFGKMELTVSGPFTVLPLENAHIRTKVDGWTPRGHLCG
jgi:hypothetical protein